MSLHLSVPARTSQKVLLAPWPCSTRALRRSVLGNPTCGQSKHLPVHWLTLLRPTRAILRHARRGAGGRGGAGLALRAWRPAHGTTRAWGRSDVAPVFPILHTWPRCTTRRDSSVPLSTRGGERPGGAFFFPRSSRPGNGEKAKATFQKVPGPRG